MSATIYLANVLFCITVINCFFNVTDLGFFISIYIKYQFKLIEKCQVVTQLPVLEFEQWASAIFNENMVLYVGGGGGGGCSQKV